MKLYRASHPLRLRQLIAIAGLASLIPVAMAQDNTDENPANNLPAELNPPDVRSPSSLPDSETPSSAPTTESDMRGARGPMRSETLNPSGSNPPGQYSMQSLQRQPNLSERSWILDLNNPHRPM